VVRLIQMFYTSDQRKISPKTNTQNLETGLANDGDQEWYAPISDATQIAGFARASGPGGPLGDPPTRLIRVSVSEGTL
jgi:hypothetical protein